MPLTLTWPDIGLRILLTVVAAIAIGFDRRSQGRPAGIRTTILVALAACLAMIETNWLMNSVGKTPDSFVALDPLRLPLGILTGVGFIGGGAILKRDDSVLGLTSAATLWFVTVVGLCIGGGQIVLGLGGAVMGVIVLLGLRGLEERVHQERASKVRIKWDRDDFDLVTALSALNAPDLKVANYALKSEPGQHMHELQCEVVHRRPTDPRTLPAAFVELTRAPGVLEWEWTD
ncbi:MAG: MgtC/SapB family protein [Hyphomicrobiales bacterium]|nr:MgtC/SapB family protein [Hyphomicrobiales bacterium]